ncbi:hypothetical protein [Pseudaestuariivita atlantica]|uniref:Uncharacterized protein n=1 Tax=Pseudaestuariivita atlantica TaxID=1317121 RepID=A0A0L1JR67_9RHOB|nr:hypothetical protein [Pseudaestuariivita atlantica]KNG94284.1 hypothetical protein ATO11_08745 [Pseudaestuariivita atlantica]
MKFRSEPLKTARLRTTLAQERQMTSLLDREIIGGSHQIVPHRENWVPMWVDTGHVVRSDCGTMFAERSITRGGRLIWLVTTEGKSHAYHATAQDPFAAFEQATEARDRRRFVRGQWDVVKRLQRDLMLGRRRFDVLIDDAAASPLCAVGIQYFMSRIGMGRVRRVSGRVAALMMMIEPQVGFVIYEAARRHGVLSEMPEGRDAVTSAMA